MSANLDQTMSVRLPPELRQRIVTLAQATRRSQGDVVREVLERDLGNLEWEQRIANRARAHRSGEIHAISSTEVDQLLGLDGVSPAEDALDSVL